VLKAQSCDSCRNEFLPSIEQDKDKDPIIFLLPWAPLLGWQMVLETPEHPLSGRKIQT